MTYIPKIVVGLILVIITVVISVSITLLTLVIVIDSQGLQTNISSMVATPTQVSSIQQRMSLIESSINELNEKVDSGSTSVVDGFATFADTLSGIATVLIAIAALIATRAYRTRQFMDGEANRDIVKVQTISTLLPHLQSGDEKTIEASLRSIKLLGNGALATDLATIFRSSYGAVAALVEIAGEKESTYQTQATKSLINLVQPEIAINIENVGVISSRGKYTGTTFFIKQDLLLTTHYSIADPVIYEFFLSGKNYSVGNFASHNNGLSTTVFEQEDQSDKRLFRFDLTYTANIGETVYLIGTINSGRVVPIAGTILSVHETNINYQSKSLIHIKVPNIPREFRGAPVFQNNGSLIGIVLHLEDLILDDHAIAIVLPISEVEESIDYIATDETINNASIDTKQI